MAQGCHLGVGFNRSRENHVEERLVSDYCGSGLTTGPHPMFYRREEMRKLNIKSAAELRETKHGKKATVAGAVITRRAR
jgi:error-prone DNA polymerase